MAAREITLIFSLLAIFSKGHTSGIQTQHTVLAAVGDKACLNCELMLSKDVLQVTWQMISGSSEKNMATYNKYFGPRVNSEFTKKVEFKNPELQNCTIVIRNVTQQDEGCYRCLFNTYPEGAFTGRTCLQVYGKDTWSRVIEENYPRLKLNLYLIYTHSACGVYC
ncbi:OX-2 membrane glycoprotein-like [Neolamprologus brichardi]|uniref:OX-2 membrane glycoprotein-like n=1 Tax=Neolamprologus brichardi TaxID=32507 RepID=UPI001643EFBB|nr:OX-2 membrane glycoprotein-like [Neolamprologus brichardi]